MGVDVEVCPRFQFANDRRLPHLTEVLTAINQEARPVAVQRFFLTVSPDLESEVLNKTLSPRDWLLTGHASAPVVLLAREI